MNKKLYLNVFKCINADSCDNFNDYFEIMNNKTRNNGILIRLPKIRLDDPFITEQNASMISQHRLEVLKIVKSS